MEQDTKQQEGNKLIAEGNKLILESPFASEYHKKWLKKWKVYNYHGEFPYHELKYHTSWDWLMPVVEKIFLTGAWDFSIIYMYCTIWGDHEQPPYINNQGETTIEAVWKSCIQFIQWYNSQPVKADK